MTPSFFRSRKSVSFARVASTVAALTVVTVLAQTHASFAQGPGGGGGFGGGGFGGGQRGGQRGGGNFQQQPLTVSSLSLAALKSQLSLTADQETKIKPILDDIQKQRDGLTADRQKMMDSFRNRQNGGQGAAGAAAGAGTAQGGAAAGGDAGAAGGGQGRGGRRQMDPAMQQVFQDMQTKQTALSDAEKKADHDIDEMLTPDQRETLRGVLKDATLFRSLGLPFETFDTVKLTDEERPKLNTVLDDSRREQRTMMAKMQNPGDGGADPRTMRDEMMKARDKTKDDALAALTAEHKATVDAYMKAHPQQPGMGGPGGFGGGFGGGRGNRGGGGGNGAPPAQQ